jgi:hypothetical protein
MIAFVDGPLRHREAQHQDSAALAALRARSPRATDPAAPIGPARGVLLDLIRTGHPEQARRALTRLAEAAEDDRSTHDPELADVLGALLHHRELTLRLHAHRISRAGVTSNVPERSSPITVGRACGLRDRSAPEGG